MTKDGHNDIGFALGNKVEHRVRVSVRVRVRVRVRLGFL